MKRLWITVVALLVDLVTKELVTNRFELWESVDVLGDFFRLTYIHNPGAVFGIKLGSGTVHLLLSTVAMVIVISMLVKTPPEDRWGGIGLALVLGGAIGNIIDRLRYGVVIDFLDLGIGDVRWYVFNVADACVSVGVILLIIGYGRDQPEDQADPGRGSGE
ncbi:MAG: signal peptidase II [Gemmatimonadetes bacterium]|nr:signal peptidase II [Gemmatimonadota bacterium]